jgi:hypothetical protein
MIDRVVSFDESSHTYRLNGKLVPLSVTGVLGITGFSDMSSIPPKVLENKRRIGTHVHKATELLDTVGLDWDSVRADCLGYIAAYRSFIKKEQPEWHTIESRGVMEVNGMLCGYTNDRGGYIKGEPYVVDLKCALTAEDYWAYQVAGYALGMDKMPGQTTPYRRMVVHLKPDSTYKVIPYPNDAHDTAVFKSALHIASIHVAEGRVKEERRAS